MGVDTAALRLYSACYRRHVGVGNYDHGGGIAAKFRARIHLFSVIADCSVISLGAVVTKYFSCFKEIVSENQRENVYIGSNFVILLCTAFWDWQLKRVCFYKCFWPECE